LIILRVTLVLAKSGMPHIEYPDLQKAKEEGKALDTPSVIGDTVRAIRARKFPDLAVFGTAGSFFKNPIISKETYDALVTKYGPVPEFPNPNGVKIPLAFILDKVLGLKGFRLGNAFLFDNQPLVLVADHGASAHEVDTLAKLVETKVMDATGIKIEREVKTLF
jgi:UDP-N-acetylmuramate dehydrogenase